MEGGESDDHGNGRDDFEIDEGLDAEAANLFEIGMAGNSYNENAEEQRRDDDLDQTKKDVTENAKMFSRCRRIEAKLETAEHGDKDPQRERTPANRGVAQGEKAEATKNEKEFVRWKE